LPITGIQFFSPQNRPIAACRAQIGSISVTVTMEPAPLKDASSFAYIHQYPVNYTLLPAEHMGKSGGVALAECIHSTFLHSVFGFVEFKLVTESFNN